MAPLSEYQRIRVWLNAVRLAERDPARLAEWGRAGVSIRKLLRALGAAANISGSTVTGFGVRWLALMSGLDHTTVSRLLHVLRQEDDPLIRQVGEHHDVEPDRYALRVPSGYRADAAWMRWRAGRVDAIHPVMRELPGPAAFVYEVLGTEPAAAGELSRVAAVSRTAAAAALTRLAELGLAERELRGWRRGPVSLGAAAAAAGADTRHKERAERYAEQRCAWRAKCAGRPGTPIPATEPDPDRDTGSPGRDGSPDRGPGMKAHVGDRAPPDNTVGAVAILREHLGGVVITSVSA